MEQHEQAGRIPGSNKEQELLAFGIVLRRVRKDRRLSQEQLGWNTHTDQKYISELERGTRDPGFRTILKLLRGLDMPISVFMAEVEKALRHHSP